MYRSTLFDLGWERTLYPRKTEGDVIVLYHNVFSHTLPGFNARNLGQRQFAEQLAYFRKRYAVVPLEEIYQTPPKGRRRCAITFDDGLVCTSRHAESEINRARVPVTVFVCTPYLKGRSILWPDHLSMTGIHTRRDLTFRGTVYRWRRSNRYISDEGVKLTQVLMQSPEAEILEFLDTVERDTGYRPSEDTRNDSLWRVMRGEEIRILSENPLVEIGSHGVLHSNMCLLSPEEAREELTASRDYLERATGKKVTSLAYPFGLYTRQLLDIASEVGYKRQLAVQFRFPEDHSDPRLRARTGVYNDRSVKEQIHLVNRAFFHS